MSDPVIIALISMCGTIPAAATGIVSAYFAYRASVTTKETKTITEATAAVAKHTEQNTNHLKDEIVALTKKASFAEGHKAATDENAKHNPKV
jgi:hypothetical protein